MLLIYTFGQLSWWIIDSRVPIEPAFPVATTISGQSTAVQVDFPVHYVDLHNCSILVSIYLTDKNGRYVDIMATRYLDSEGLQELSRLDPYHLKFILVVPGYIETPAKLHAQILSMCNPIQVIWPLSTLLSTNLIRTAS